MMEALETLNTQRFPMCDSRRTEDRSLFHVTGPSCDSQDTILFDVPLSADLQVGDVVEIGSAGAYTSSYASTFNGFVVPPTVCEPEVALIDLSTAEAETVHVGPQ
jgi:ornithine decarboxylase